MTCLSAAAASLLLPVPAQADVTFLLNVRPTVTEGNSGTQLLRFQATSMTVPVPLQRSISGTLSVWPGPGSSAVGGASCSPGVDFIQFTNKPFTIPAGSSPPYFLDVVVCGDTVPEPSKNVTMAIQPNSLCVGDGCLQYGTIQDDDTASTPTAPGLRPIQPQPGLFQPPANLQQPRPNCRLINGSFVCN
ncbi:MAG: hypothetical protein VKK62_05430 [Synechococcaceae cyanobacterium]|nr:hypothetical protein [Synechococcaceae cyanobacterium]